MWVTGHSPAWLWVAWAGLASACAPTHATAPPAVAARPPAAAGALQRPAEPIASDYLNHVAYAVPPDEPVLLRWPAAAMPLRVHLPAPPPGLVSDPGAALEAARLGILAWSGVVAPGLPSFVFVERPSRADVPIVWAAGSRGSTIAACRYRIDVSRRRLGVSRLTVAARRNGAEQTPLSQIEAAVLHEMGHALGLTGHSPHPLDVMYHRVTRWMQPRLSTRDRNTLRALYARPRGAPLPASFVTP